MLIDLWIILSISPIVVLMLTRTKVAMATLLGLVRSSGIPVIQCRNLRLSSLLYEVELVLVFVFVNSV